MDSFVPMKDDFIVDVFLNGGLAKYGVDMH